MFFRKKKGFLLITLISSMLMLSHFASSEDAFTLIMKTNLFRFMFIHEGQTFGQIAGDRTKVNDYTLSEQELPMGADVQQMRDYKRIFIQSLYEIVENHAELADLVSQYRPVGEQNQERFDAIFNEAQFSTLKSLYLQVIDALTGKIKRQDFPIRWIITSHNHSTNTGGDPVISQNLGRSHEDLVTYKYEDTETWGTQVTDRMFQTLLAIEDASRDRAFLEQVLNNMQPKTDEASGASLDFILTLSQAKGVEEVSKMLKVMRGALASEFIFHEMRHYLDMPFLDIRHLEAEIQQNPETYLREDGSLNMAAVKKEGLDKDADRRVDEVEPRGFALGRAASKAFLTKGLSKIFPDMEITDQLISEVLFSISELMAKHIEHKSKKYERGGDFYYAGAFQPSSTSEKTAAPSHLSYILDEVTGVHTGMAFPAPHVEHYMKTQRVGHNLDEALVMINDNPENPEALEYIREAFVMYYDRFIDDSPWAVALLRFMPLTKRSLQLDLINKFELLQQTHPDVFNKIEHKGHKLDKALSMKAEAQKILDKILTKRIKSKINYSKSIKACSQIL